MSQKSLSVIVLFLLAVFSITTAFSLTAPALFSVSAGSSSCPASKTVTWAMEPIPQSFNLLAPTGDSTFEIGTMEYLSIGPFPLEPNGSLDWSDVATNWITSNSNFTQWTFHIRPGLTWSNGTAVTGSDIANWLTPAYALNSQYDFVGLHTEVTGVQVVNSDTATVILNKTDAQFPTLVSAYYYAPMQSPTDVAKGPADTLFGTGIADGPWYVSNYTSGSTTALMLPNPYWPGVKPYACAIDIIFVENAAQMIPFLVSSQADAAGPLTYGNLAALQGHSNIHLNTYGGNFGTFMMYNITHYPYNMTEFRQAIAYAMNTSEIIQQSEFG
ncbi:MAG: ABC transporter substrate-binding protein, partial [Rhabdochlamydiaceae bacterium]